MNKTTINKQVAINTSMELDEILITSFGNVFTRLVNEKKITTDQYLTLLEETKKEVEINLGIAIAKKEEVLRQLSEPLSK